MRLTLVAIFAVLAGGAVVATPAQASAGVLRLNQTYVNTATSARATAVRRTSDYHRVKTDTGICLMDYQPDAQNPVSTPWRITGTTTRVWRFPCSDPLPVAVRWG